MLGFIGLIIGNQFSLQRKITMQERRDIYVGPPTFFLGPAVPPPQFFILESPLVPRLCGGF